MKIACVSTSRVPSSTANSIELLKVCHALAQEGAEVRLWVPGTSSTEWEKLARYYGLSLPFEITWLRSNPILKRYDFTWQALRQARAWGAQMLYTWLPQAAFYAQRTGLPTALEVHNFPTGQLGPWLLRSFAHSRGKKCILPITQALFNRLESDWGLRARPEEVQIAPMGTDLEQYAHLPEAPSARQMLNLPEKITAGYSGHFYAGRGMDLLLGLAQGFPQVSFLWVGGRPEDVETWRTKLSQAGIQNIILTGFVENARLPLYQAAADVLLMPYERAIAGSSGGNTADICSPMKMFDYLATGRAILTSDLPVFHEVLNENNAVFAPPQNLPAWITAMQILIGDASLRQRLGEQARQDAVQYTWRARAKRVIDHFERNT
jgi:glycosyltransferase involved in cell wall biosynthesis